MSARFLRATYAMTVDDRVIASVAADLATSLPERGINPAKRKDAMRKQKSGLVSALMFISIVIAAWSTLVMSEEVPLVDGKLWGKSSEVEKKSYLVGASNFMSLEYEYQKKGANPPTVDQSTVPAFWAHTENVTLDQAIQTIDGWYESHPDRMDTPVLGVLWLELVKPHL